jgi:hypothetical protein
VYGPSILLYLKSLHQPFPVSWSNRRVLWAWAWASNSVLVRRAQTRVQLARLIPLARGGAGPNVLDTSFRKPAVGQLAKPRIHPGNLDRWMRARPVFFFFLISRDARKYSHAPPLSLTRASP